jgi:hypothetical protein
LKDPRVALGAAAFDVYLSHLSSFRGYDCKLRSAG